MNKTKLLLAALLSNRLTRKTLLCKVLQKCFGLHLKYNRNRAYNPVFRHLSDVGSICNDISLIDIDSALVQYFIDDYFNVLGSGWVQCVKGSPVNGYLNKRYSDVLYSTCTSECESNEVIWNCDIRTGYIFKQKYYNSSLIDSLPEGVDIKVPWELGRMYHWSYLAIAAIKFQDQRELILEKFRKQMLSYMNRNPVGIGVGYFCSMEVAIRSINLLFSYDILLQYDSNNILDNAFRRVFERYLYSMSVFIEHNIEYNLSGEKNGNHYLANLTGLLWIYMYFNCKRKLNYLIPLFLQEIDNQFLIDGSGIECSVLYHRLSSELAVLGMIPVLRNTDYKNIKQETLERFYGMRRLLISSTGIDGNLIQIGDNDSGRVLKLHPIYFNNIENSLSPNEVIGYVSSLLKDGDYTSVYNIFSWYKIHEKPAFKPSLDNKLNMSEDSIHSVIRDYSRFQYQKKIILKTGLTNKLDDCCISYERGFGLIKISDTMRDLFIRVAPDYRLMMLAHAHNDVLHFEVCSDTRRFYSDCGSITYSASDEIRKLYVGEQRHNIPIHRLKIFTHISRFENKIESQIHATVNFFRDGIVICLKCKYYEHIRCFVIEDDKTLIFDFSNDRFETNMNSLDTYSYGYGQVYQFH